MDADDLGRHDGRQVHRLVDAHLATVVGHQRRRPAGRRRRRCRPAGSGGSREGHEFSFGGLSRPQPAAVSSGPAFWRMNSGSSGVLRGRGKPPSGRSNHRCTWPVPIEFSYSPYWRAGRGAVALAERADHHQVVAESGLGLEPVELRHGFQHPGMVALANHSSRSTSAAAASAVKMCSTPAGLVIAQLAQRPERVRQRAGGDQHDLAVGLGDARRRGPGRAAGCPRCPRSGTRRSRSTACPAGPGRGIPTRWSSRRRSAGDRLRSR